MRSTVYVAALALEEAVTRCHDARLLSSDSIPATTSSEGTTNAPAWTSGYAILLRPTQAAPAQACSSMAMPKVSWYELEKAMSTPARKSHYSPWVAKHRVNRTLRNPSSSDDRAAYSSLSQSGTPSESRGLLLSVRGLHDDVWGELIQASPVGTLQPVAGHLVATLGHELERSVGENPTVHIDQIYSHGNGLLVSLGSAAARESHTFGFIRGTVLPSRP